MDIEQNPKHTYKANGNYQIRLTVTAPDGLSCTVSNTIQISELSEIPPVKSRCKYELSSS